MKILAVNAGSSSLKFQMYEMPEEKVLISGVFERIGIDNSFYTIKLNGEKIRKEVDLSNHSVAVGFLTKELLENNIVESLEEIKGVGHRIVQGADKFDKTVVVDDMVEGIIGDLSHLGLVGLTGKVGEYASTIPDLGFAMFQMMFAIITPALITGAVAGRMKFKALFLFIIFWSTLVYYPMAHMVWGIGGFLAKIGSVDFAGGNVVIGKRACTQRKKRPDDRSQDRDNKR